MLCCEMDVWKISTAEALRSSEDVRGHGDTTERACSIEDRYWFLRVHSTKNITEWIEVISSRNGKLSIAICCRKGEYALMIARYDSIVCECIERLCPRVPSAELHGGKSEVMYDIPRSDNEHSLSSQRFQRLPVAVLCLGTGVSVYGEL